MAIKFKLIQKNDLKGGKKFYPQVITNGNVSFTKLCQEISEQSSLTEGDVKNCLDRLSYVLANHLSDGQNVSLGDLGSFGVLSRGNGVESEEAWVTGRDMRRPSVRYFPGKRLREVQDKATYERVKLKVDGTTEPEEPTTPPEDNDGPDII